MVKTLKDAILSPLETLKSKKVWAVALSFGTLSTAEVVREEASINREYSLITGQVILPIDQYDNKKLVERYLFLKERNVPPFAPLYQLADHIRNTNI